MLRKSLFSFPELLLGFRFLDKDKDHIGEVDFRHAQTEVWLIYLDWD